MDNDLIARLRTAMSRATKRPWKYYNKVFRPQFSNRRVTEIQRCDGESIVSWTGFDGTGVGNRFDNHNARLIVLAVNSIEPLIDALAAAQAEIAFQINQRDRDYAAFMNAGKRDRAEIARLREVIETWHGEYSKLEVEIAALDKLRGYAMHDEGCATNQDISAWRCDCGLTDAIRALKDKP